jgi:hypothetical protein
MNKNRLLILLGSLILIISCVYILTRRVDGFHAHRIEIVVARYNEDLNWLKEEPFDSYPIVCYNSGSNEDFYRPPRMRVVNIEDVGKEAYVFLYHILENYDDLADITIFLPGSADTPHKFKNAKKQVYEVQKHNRTVFIATEFDNVRDSLYEYQMEDYCSTSPENSKLNSACKLNPASARPFGKWYDTFFKGVDVQHVNYSGILGIQRSHIIQHSKEHYQRLIGEIQHPNDEVAHYFERSWAAIFHPMEGAIYTKEATDYA